MNIRPIRNDDDHRAALAEIDRLWGAAPGTDDGDALDVLLVLVDGYESKRFPVNQPEFDPVDAINYAINEMGHTQAELGALLESRPRASEILSRKRTLTVEMIRTISDDWKIPTDILVRPYRNESAA